MLEKKEVRRGSKFMTHGVNLFNCRWISRNFLGRGNPLWIRILISSWTIYFYSYCHRRGRKCKAWVGRSRRSNCKGTRAPSQIIDIYFATGHVCVTAVECQRHIQRRTTQRSIGNSSHALHTTIYKLRSRNFHTRSVITRVLHPRALYIENELVLAVDNDRMALLHR